MPAKKKTEVVGRAVVRAEATDDGEVRLVHGNEMPGEDELGFKEGQSWLLSDEAALELAEALPGVVQQARNAVP